MRNLLLSTILIFFISCGAQKVIIYNLDYVITYRLNSNLQLNPAQKEELENDVGNFLNSNKEYSALKINSILEQVRFNKKDQSPKYTVKNSTKILTQIDDVYFHLSAHFTPILSEHIASLSTKQQRKYLIKLEEKGQEIQKVPIEESLEKALSRFSYMFGDLNKEQIELINKFIQGQQRFRQLRFKHRALFAITTDEIFILKEEKERRSAFEILFKKYDVDFEKRLKENQVKNLIPFWIQFANNLSEKQKDHFNERLDEIRSWIVYFAKQSY